MNLHWIGMDTQTRENRNRKARQIRNCRKYLTVAKQMGLTEKSTTVRFWKQQLQELRGETL